MPGSTLQAVRGGCWKEFTRALPLADVLLVLFEPLPARRKPSRHRATLCTRPEIVGLPRPTSRPETVLGDFILGDGLRGVN